MGANEGKEKGRWDLSEVKIQPRALHCKSYFRKETCPFFFFFLPLARPLQTPPS